MIEIEKERKLENQYCGVYLEVEDRKRNRREMKDFNKKERIVYLCKKNYQRKERDRGKMISLVEGKYWKMEISVKKN